VCERNDADRAGPLGSGREGGGARAGADRRDPPVRHQGRAGASARMRGWAYWADWAKMSFSISREFLMPFPFIFYMVFNSNSNQV
jgi:hypothetical protein